MAKIAIITDTDASLPAELAASNAIVQVPILVNFGEDTYTTGVDINDQKLFEKIDRLGRLPTTSAPAPSAFSKAFQEAFSAGADEIVCICVSSKVSATYNAAVTAAVDFPDHRISVVDSLSISMGQGFMALAAAKAAREGASHDEVVAAAMALPSRLHLYATLSTLKYLAMSGRVGKLAAGMANMLNIRPILTMKEGKLDMLEKVRTKKVAMARLLELVQEAIGGKPVEQVAFIHVNNLEDALHLREQLGKMVDLPAQYVTAEFTAGLSVHTGSGTVGVVVLTGK